MSITLSQIIVWIIVGALAGSLTGMIVKRSKEGFGKYMNFGIGLVGAFIGGLLFELFNINLGLGSISVSFEDILAAIIGSLLFLIIIWIIQTQREKRQKTVKRET
jgi:uncharacterized membrane protein YeaQ/YmgE (transglycosylase-associated protein family)